ncbi:MAG: type pilus assembly protein PilY [Polaromonas sp.]|nr:type pilus assembly protein PilY [Polaromonas sp.]
MNLKKSLSWGTYCAAAVMMVGSGAQTTAIPSVDLSLGPLTVTAQAVNIALALSVEFPTAGAAYRAGSYDHSVEYLGYWDPKSCYEYFDANDTSQLKGEYFRRTGSVDSSKYCNTPGVGTGYSGNVLNYAATSSIDLLRFALTGGNRALDAANKTVLGRTYLPSNFSFRDTSYFPQKQVASALVGKVTPQFITPGATTNYSGTVYFNSCNDLLFVGNAASGDSCATPGNTNIFAPLVPNLSGNVTTQYFPFTPTNTASTTYVLDPAGSKQWVRSVPEATTTIMPTGTDPVAGTLVPEAVSPTPRNMAVITGTFNTPQRMGENPATYIYTPTGQLTSAIPPADAPDISIQSYIWQANTGSHGTAYYEGIQAELNSSNLGNAANGTPSDNISHRVCRSGSGSNVTNIRLRINSSNDKCPDGGSGTSLNIQTYRLYTRVAQYKAYTVTPLYNYYQEIPTWYQSSVGTGYKAYTNGTSPAKMKAYVQVCDNAEGPTRQGSDGVRFCKRYPNETASSGVYKPIGELQTRAEGVRVSAFGYALENGNGRYGGVLRAPMKFLGPQYRDTAGVLQSNAQAEWDATTGVFVTDPLNAAGGSSAFPAGAPAFTTSGVANYLNNFGSTGIYKSNDPVGELYYETLRYFQGLQPTDAAVANLTAASMYDNFPIYKTWTDPIQNGCQRRNFILTIGDVNSHYDKQLPGHGTNGVSETTTDPTRTALAIPGSATKTFSAVEWAKLLTGFETGANYSYIDALGRDQNTLGNPNVVSGNTGLSTKTTGSQSSAYYWAGAAYWANTQPIREDSITIDGKTQSLKETRVKTFTIDVDEGGNGSIDSNTRGIKPRNSSFFLAGKYGWFNDANDDGNPFKTSGGQTNNKEWEDPSLANVPDGYALASQAQRMIAGIRKFFASASVQSGSVSVSSLSSQRFSSSSPSGDLFASRFDSHDWSGTVIKSSLALNTTTQTIDAQQNVAWDAGAILTTGSTMAESVTAADPYIKPVDRKIFTYRRDATGNPGIAFTAANLGQFDTAMQDALNADPITGVADSLGALRLSYLRGDRTQEGADTNAFRRRSSLMGDIINSGPIYKKEADSSLAGDSSYLTFSKSVASRTATVYVGANDGMLHALRASDGKELFAYVPLAVAKNLNKLTNPAYQHLPFVDGIPEVGEAKLGTDWRTVLVSGMGGGAQGIFALDVTNPDAFEDGSTDAGKALFEFTDQDDPMMGNVLAQPKIVKLKIPSTTTGGAPSYKWFVAVGSGYNNYVNDGSGRYSTTGDQALFLLSLDKAAGAAWAEGTNYFKIVVPAASTATANSLANPGFGMGDLGEVKTMYAGDLQGQLWKFDFSEGLSSANISGNKLLKVVNGVKKPLFTAKTSAGVAQPITTTPLVTTAQRSGVMVVFGTGKFVEQNDAASSGTQSIYSVWDNSGIASTDYGLTRSSLQQQTAAESSSAVNITATAVTLGTASGEKRGAYFDLPNGRERIAVNGAQGLNTVTFNSMVPSGDCSGDGIGRTYTLNPVTLANSSTIALDNGIGLSSPPNYISLEDNTYSIRRADGVRKYKISNTVVNTGTQLTSAGNVRTQTIKVPDAYITSGRISWREVRSFND